MLLYDTEVETGDFNACAFSRIEPAANSIVFHPGAYVHEITRVVCGTDRFTDARFAMTCTLFLGRRSRTPPPFSAYGRAAAVDLDGLQRHGEGCPGRGGNHRDLAWQGDCIWT